MGKNKRGKSTDELKKELEQSSAQLKNQLKSELHDVTSQVQKTTTTLLLVGGGLLVGYKLYQWMTSRNDQDSVATDEESVSTQKKGRRSGSRLGHVGSVLIQYTSLYALSILRDKLVEYLESVEFEEDSEDEN